MNFVGCIRQWSVCTDPSPPHRRGCERLHGFRRINKLSGLLWAVRPLVQLACTIQTVYNSNGVHTGSKQSKEATIKLQITILIIQFVHCIVVQHNDSQTIHTSIAGSTNASQSPLFSQGRLQSPNSVGRLSVSLLFNGVQWASGEPGRLIDGHRGTQVIWRL